ncbi:ABC transporter ATP-binding protein [Cryptosporangium aurantiacum]|uniref:Amino acid/amide ABC transporter ATP-binding protein 1, HAAT family n=1 Tax=Cryptosporangium aurantiacum TaxID=134849 RepID=A0A1M7PDX9_9ACTN|nr:ATP-binding cassette domain-containing protein [Cryptosporangium aurantiacum]SHN15147.1 amino acid/amide ABC transporter ATP-binding protein 1, HAAT family [Cryptosporangium aurantiacum]
MTAVLRTTGLAVRYGGVSALSDADLTVEAGELVGLIGPNGAGKTTFIDAVTGFARSTGRVELTGRELTGLPPHVRARHGLARTWQAAELFDDLSVRDNVIVAAGGPGFRRTARELLRGRGEGAAAADAVLDRLGLTELADTEPTQLSQGQRKLVGVARALAARPALLCLDEPAAGLDSTESAGLGKHLRSVVDGGTPMLLVDHDMGLVLSVCDRVVVLDFGRVIADGPPEEIRTDQRVLTAYLGSSASPEATR